MAEEGIAAGGVMVVNIALQEVLKTALIHDGLARGIREAAKALDKHQAHLCVLASNCDEPMYVNLVEALCAEHQINLIKVDDNKKLGERVGLCKTDRENPVKWLAAAVWWSRTMAESQAKDVIEEYFKCKKWSNKKTGLWASLVAHWLRIRLPMQGTRVRALVWEDPTCRGATWPVSHNYWACVAGACAPQQERPR